MSEPVPTTITLSEDQIREIAIQLARHLPTYLIYRDPPVVPAGSVVPPVGVVQTSVEQVTEVQKASGANVETIL